MKKILSNNGRQLEPKINQDLFTSKTFAKLATEVTNNTIFPSAFKRRNILILRPTILYRCMNHYKYYIL